MVQLELDYLSFAIWAKIDFVRDGLTARIAVENHVSEGERVSEGFEGDFLCDSFSTSLG